MVTYRPSYESFDVHREDRLVTITFNHPETLNAVTPTLHEELAEFFHQVSEDPGVGCIILTGEGRAFSAGANFKRLRARIETEEGDNRPEIRSIVYSKRLIVSMLEVEQPIIGAVNGDAIGLGATLAFACDIIVANERARFADTHVKNLAVPAGDGGAIMWPLMMPIHKAKEYLLTGDFLVAGDAARWGYINYALPADEVMPKALELGKRFAYGPPWAQRWTKTTVNKVLRERLNLLLDTGLLAERACFFTDDHHEAVSAFLEKRPPNYAGH